MENNLASTEINVFDYSGRFYTTCSLENAIRLLARVSQLS